MGAVLKVALSGWGQPAVQGITRTELAEQCGISEDGIKWQLGQLKKKNIIRRVGADKGGYWQIITESENKKEL